jgi:hypothetical protein
MGEGLSLFELEQGHERLYLSDQVWRAMVAGSLTAETGRGERERLKAKG